MKLQSILYFLLIITIPAYSQTKKVNNIKFLTQQWVDANNAQDMETLGSLYAPSLNFYAINKDKATCIKEKLAFFKKHQNYSISINNIDIDFYKSGIIRCNFMKSEIWDDITKNSQQGYLLFEKAGNSYRIIAESDSKMDRDRKYVPPMGEKIQNSSKVTYMLVGAGALLLILSVVYLIKKNKDQKKKLESVPMLFSQPLNVEEDVKLPEFTTEELKKNNGLAFEEYVVKNFDRNYFKLLNWRGDKFVDGLYPLSNMDPDLDYIYQDKARHERFAIECKWRHDFINNTIKLAEERQIINYRNYQNKKQYPVFVILGVGGTGMKPADLYIIPLSEIGNPVLTKENLIKYYRYSKAKFFLKIPELKLT